MGQHKDRRRISKENLALAARKDFNAAIISEPDTITSFLYSVHHQGKTNMKSVWKCADQFKQRVTFTRVLLFQHPNNTIIRISVGAVL